MSLVEREKAPKGPSRGQCAVCWLLSRMPDEEAEALRKMMGSADWTHSEIAAAVSDEGYDWPIARPEHAVGNHRQQKHP